MPVLQHLFIAGSALGLAVVIVLVIIADRCHFDGDDIKLVLCMLSLGLTIWASYQSRDFLKTAVIVAGFLVAHAIAFVFIPAAFRMLCRPGTKQEVSDRSSV